jgi:putative selenate reductase
LAAECPDALPRALREAAVSAGLDAEAIVLRATRVAGRLNGREIVSALAGDSRYLAQSNKKEPRRLARTLDLYDCINCDLCIPACPNDAIFAYEAKPLESLTERVRILRGGPARPPMKEASLERGPGKGFAIRKRHQLAVVAGLCNDCSNCEVYCPEQGAPFKLKERVFLSLADFQRAPARDGFCRLVNTLYARLGGLEMVFEPEPERNRASVLADGFRLDLRWDSLEVLSGRLTDSEEVSMDTDLFWRMKTVWESIFHSARPNMVNPDPSIHRTKRTA